MCGNAWAQSNTYIVYFTDKNDSPFLLTQPEVYLSQKSIERREKQGITIETSDLPVNPHYIDSLEEKGVSVRYTSKWLNAALIESTTTQLSQVLQLSIIQSHESTKLSAKEKNTQGVTSSIEYGDSEEQIDQLNLDIMHELGFTGSGKTIAFFDNGFSGVNTNTMFQHLWDNNKVLGYYDFVEGDTTVFDGGQHGTNVASVALAKQEGTLIGGSYNAGIAMFCTESDAIESIIETFYWVLAAEFSDSIGVDIISSSVGYNQFDNSTTNFTWEELDGQSTAISRGAQMATEKGVFVVATAGNEGSSSWKKILFPGDAKDVLTVGGVTSANEYWFLASVGNTADGRIKPEVASLAVNVAIGVEGGGVAFSSGTSFAVPMISAFVAGLWEAFPELTVLELKEVIVKSSHQYTEPDSLIGYGIPDFFKAYEIALGTSTNGSLISNSKVFPNPFEESVINISLDNVNLSNEITISIYDRVGRLIQQETNQHAEKVTTVYLNQSASTQQLLIVKITTPKNTQVHRVIKY